MKIGLGTAQFGFDYGISNLEGKVPGEQVKRILDAAAESGVRVIDTASLYGDSESILGRFLREGHAFNIVTKTPQYSKPQLTRDDARLLERTFQESLVKLKQPSLYGLLIHNADDLLAENGILLWESMADIKSKGMVKNIGVSVYSARQIDAILEKFPIDLIQLPVNVLDQRLIRSGHLKKLKRKGIEIHARSVFLQGLLLMDPAKLHDYFGSVREHLQHYNQFIETKSLSRIKAALDFVLSLGEVDAIIVGVVNSVQLDEIINECMDAPKMTLDDYGLFSWSDDGILDPFRWKVVSI
jgi:aryl-alcohol dehydrogenase-like predicted oxidoreductase